MCEFLPAGMQNRAGTWDIWMSLQAAWTSWWRCCPLVRECGVRWRVRRVVAERREPLDLQDCQRSRHCHQLSPANHTVTTQTAISCHLPIIRWPLRRPSAVTCQSYGDHSDGHQLSPANHTVTTQTAISCHLPIIRWPLRRPSAVTCQSYGDHSDGHQLSPANHTVTTQTAISCHLPIIRWPLRRPSAVTCQSYGDHNTTYSNLHHLSPTNHTMTTIPPTQTVETDKFRATGNYEDSSPGICVDNQLSSRTTHH